MFNITLMLHNPFAKELLHNNLFNKVRSYGNKVVELNLYRTATLLTFDMSLWLRGDHRPEFYFSLGLLGFNIEFSFYDKRHFSEEILY